MSRDEGFRLVQLKGSYGKREICEGESLEEIREFIEAKTGTGVVADGD
jgi:hypothetical protein